MADKKPAPKAKAKAKGKMRSSLYDNGKPKNSFCPKCGPGYFLGAHKDRKVCGKCGYMEKI